jgi:hypothetical protein
MLEPNEKWVRPIQIRRLLERCNDSAAPKPPEANSAYVVTIRRWRSAPNSKSVPLYVGGNTGKSARFRTRVGDLLADAFGFYGSATGHHSGGQSIHKWCKDNKVNPLDLYIAWVEGTKCPRCLEVRLCQELKPKINKVRPSSCKKH